MLSSPVPIVAYAAQSSMPLQVGLTSHAAHASDSRGYASESEDRLDRLWRSNKSLEAS